LAATIDPRFGLMRQPCYGLAGNDSDRVAPCDNELLTCKSLAIACCKNSAVS
jgi:hypothetical protein